MKTMRTFLCLLLIAGLTIHLPLPALAAGPDAAPATEETAPPTEAATEPEETAEPETGEAPLPSEGGETQPLPEEEEAQPSMNSQSSSMSFESPDPKQDPDYFPGYDQVPLMLQTDYPLVPYSDGTLYTSGCTMACVAMVASFLRQEEILPNELAHRFGDYDASNIQRMEAASTVLDLKYHTTFQWWDVVEALKQDKVVILLLDAASYFTNTQHTVVLRGITHDGKILVHDPYGPNYEDPWLRQGFKEGFPQQTLRDGFSQAWIYDGYEPPPVGQSRYPDIQMSSEERDLLAKIIWLEARGESFEGQQAIAEIVFNRIASGKFNKTVKGTIMAQDQFSTTKFLDDAEPGELQYKAIDMALSGPNVLPMDVYYFGRRVTNENVWGRIGRHVFCYEK